MIGDRGLTDQPDRMIVIEIGHIPSNQFKTNLQYPTFSTACLFGSSSIFAAQKLTS